MKYILTAGWDDGVAALTERLVRELADGKRVLWLVCGGSNIPSIVQVMRGISPELSKGLTISLTDERYGEPGHKDSNWEQLKHAGFDTEQASTLPVLGPGKDLDRTVKDYGLMIGKAMDDNDITIAQFGIGPDGHIAGILPGSAAAEEDKALAAGYESPPLVRVTLTFPALRRVSAAYAFAFGEPKRHALKQLRAGASTIKDQPARILDELPEAYLYNDQVGEHA